MSIETPPAKIDRLDSIQALRGIAALLVVFSHLLAIETKYSPDRLSPDAFIHGFAGVDIFFVISGFIMVYVTQNARRGLGGMSEFIIARIGRIYPLYWVVSGVLLLAWMVMPTIISGNFGSEALIKSFLLYPHMEGGIVQPTFLPVGWTLIYEMSFYLVFMLSLLLPRKSLGLFLLFWAAAFGIGYALDGNRLPSAARIFFQPYTVEFLLGAFAGWVYVTRGSQYWRWALPAALIALIALAFIYPVNYPNAWTRAITLGIPATLLLMGVIGWEKAGVKTPLPLVSLGNWSYALYLTHLLTVSVLGRIWALFAGEGLIDNIIMLTLMVALSIFVAWLAYELIEKPIIDRVRKIRTRLLA